MCAFTDITRLLLGTFGIMARSELLRQILDKHLDLILFHLLDPFDESFLSKRALTTKQLATLLSVTSYQDVVSFRLVNRKFNQVYKLRFSSFLLSLPSEIHEIILGYLVQTNTDGKLMPTEKKASLSVESFAVHQPSPEDSNQTANYVRLHAKVVTRADFKSRDWFVVTLLNEHCVANSLAYGLDSRKMGLRDFDLWQTALILQRPSNNFLTLFLASTRKVCWPFGLFSKTGLLK